MLVGAAFGAASVVSLLHSHVGVGPFWLVLYEESVNEEDIG